MDRNEMVLLVRSIAYRRAHAASYLGIPVDELISVGVVAALEAEQTWNPRRGRTLTSWVYIRAQWAIQDRLGKVAREFHDLDGWESDCPDLQSMGVETRVLISEALEYLQAELTRAEWWLLWMYHGQGYSARDLSAAVGLSYGTVRNNLSKARARAVTILGAEKRVWI